jgi:hypothetical protein
MTEVAASEAALREAAASEAALRMTTVVAVTVTAS